ncbi:MAG: hypothetical protein PHO15_02065 [Eubacteriales bacterium]|nr:hypothetical protein [Eubacteriales bacterium]
MSKTSRTLRNFQAIDNIDEIIKQWEKKSGFIEGNPLLSKVIDMSKVSYGYHALSVNSTTFLTIAIDGKDVHLEAWVSNDFMGRLFSLFILPAEMPLDSKSAVGIAGRMFTKKSVSELLAGLGQEPL